MPSLHCPFPPEEEEPRLQQEVQQEMLMEIVEGMFRINISDDLEMHERADTAQSESSDEAASEEASSEEINEWDDDISNTSSESSSILSDSTLPEFIDTSSSSDEDEFEAGGFWAPPATLEEVNFNRRMSPTISRNHHQPGRNTARRSRPRRYGEVYARRERHDQPIHEQDWYRLTPFERGLTFNGFVRNLEPEAVTGYVIDGPNNLLYNVKWKNHGDERLIESSVMRTNRPDLVIDYLESIVTGTLPIP